MKYKLQNINLKLLANLLKIYKFVSVISTFIILFFLIKFLDPAYSGLSVFILVIIDLLVLLSLLYVIRLGHNITSSLLNESLDLEKYEEFNTYMNSGRLTFYKQSEQQMVYLTQAQVFCLKGQFLEGAEALNKIDLSKVVSFSQNMFNLQMLAVSGRIYLGLKDFERVKEVIASLEKLEVNHPEKHKLLDELTAMKTIVQGQSSDYFLEIKPKHRLGIVVQQYYLALNYLNQGHPHEAKISFKEIVDETPDLFYVREAKKYLEEL